MSGIGRPDTANMLQKLYSNSGRLAAEYKVGLVLGKSANVVARGCAQDSFISFHQSQVVL